MVRTASHSRQKSQRAASVMVQRFRGTEPRPFVLVIECDGDLPPEPLFELLGSAFRDFKVVQPFAERLDDDQPTPPRSRTRSCSTEGFSRSSTASTEIDYPRRLIITVDPRRVRIPHARRFRSHAA